MISLTGLAFSHTSMRLILSLRSPLRELEVGYSGSGVPFGVIYILPPPRITFNGPGGDITLLNISNNNFSLKAKEFFTIRLNNWIEKIVVQTIWQNDTLEAKTAAFCFSWLMDRQQTDGSTATYWLLRSVPNRTALTYINVNISDELGRDVDTSLFACAEGKIRVTVPTAADRVGVSSSWRSMLDTGGGHYAHGFSWTLNRRTKKTISSTFFYLCFYKTETKLNNPIKVCFAFLSLFFLI